MRYSFLGHIDITCDCCGREQHFWSSKFITEFGRDFCPRCWREYGPAAKVEAVDRIRARERETLKAQEAEEKEYRMKKFMEGIIR